MPLQFYRKDENFLEHENPRKGFWKKPQKQFAWRLVVLLGGGGVSGEGEGEPRGRQATGHRPGGPANCRTR